MIASHFTTIFFCQPAVDGSPTGQPVGLWAWQARLDTVSDPAFLSAGRLGPLFVSFPAVAWSGGRTKVPFRLEPSGLRALFNTQFRFGLISPLGPCWYFISLSNP